MYWPPASAAAAAAAAAATAALAASTDGSAGAGGGGGEPSASVFKLDILKLFMVGTGILKIVLWLKFNWLYTFIYLGKYIGSILKGSRY